MVPSARIAGQYSVPFVLGVGNDTWLLTKVGAEFKRRVMISEEWDYGGFLCKYFVSGNGHI